MTKTNVFDGSRIHVMAERCSTCIFRPANLMSLEEGRAEEMFTTASEAGGVIPCHKTIHGLREQEAVCRGFFDRAVREGHPSLQVAERLDLITYDESE